jgi:hypothetical protein
MTFKSFAIGLAAVIGGFVVWWFAFQMNPENTYVLGESAFSQAAQHMGLPTTDFVPPPPIDPKDSSRILTLTWMSKTKPGCYIEVDLDRRNAGARPRWGCKGSP